MGHCGPIFAVAALRRATQAAPWAHPSYATPHTPAHIHRPQFMWMGVHSFTYRGRYLRVGPPRTSVCSHWATTHTHAPPSAVTGQRPRHTHTQNTRGLRMFCNASHTICTLLRGGGNAFVGVLEGPGAGLEKALLPHFHTCGGVCHALRGRLCLEWGGGSLGSETHPSPQKKLDPKFD